MADLEEFSCGLVIPAQEQPSASSPPPSAPLLAASLTVREPELTPGILD